MSRTRLIGGGLLSLGIASLLLFGSLHTGKHERDHYAQVLSEIARLDGSLENSILSIQTLVEDDYDTVTEVQSQLRNLSMLISTRSDSDELTRGIEDKLDRVETFKSRHAIFLNSYRAIPVLDGELRATAVYGDLDTRPDGQLAEAQWTIYRSMFVSQAQAGHLIEQVRGSLRDNAIYEPLRSTIEWQLLNAHIDKLIEIVPAKTAIFDALHAAPLSILTNPIFAAVEAEYESRIGQARGFQLALFVFAAILILLVARSIAAIWNHKQHLEDRVQERTEELQSVNQALQEEMDSKEAIQQELAQAQKLEAVGQLSAGVAHEINTPTQYVGDNIRFLQGAFAEILGVLSKLTNRPSNDEFDDLIGDVDVTFLREEIPRAIEESVDGIDRVSSIVRALKEFAHPSKDRMPEDLNRAIESTAIVARNEWKYVAEMNLDLDPTLPPVPCVLSEINQVVLNLIVNASHAVGSVVGDQGEKGRIDIRTRHADSQVRIEIEDTGSGIPSGIVDRVFEPFFTTKEVGKGTGQGLAIAHNVIVEKHGGTLQVESEPDAGAKFIIQLPVECIEEAPEPMIA